MPSGSRSSRFARQLAQSVVMSAFRRSPASSNAAGPATVGVAVIALGDPDSSRAVYGIIAALGALGLLLVMLAIWLIRRTRPDPELLAPLERMADRSWLEQDPVAQRRALDAVRPDGATPIYRAPSVPKIDAEFDRSRPAIANFDDLRAVATAARSRPRTVQAQRVTPVERQKSSETPRDVESDATPDPASSQQVGQ